jgi:hypothetical protein
VTEKENKKKHGRRRGRVRESEIKKFKNNKWETERENEREGEFIYFKHGRGRGTVKESEIKKLKNKKWERQREIEREGEF